MASITQAPAELDLRAVSGSPLTLTVKVTPLKTATGTTIPWATVTTAKVTVQNRPTYDYPTDTSPSSNKWTVSFSAVDTQAIAAAGTVTSWALTAKIQGEGPYALLAGTLTVGTEFQPGTSGAATTTLAVTVGSATATVAVTLGGGGGGGAPSGAAGGGLAGTYPNPTVAKAPSAALVPGTHVAISTTGGKAKIAAVLPNSAVLFNQADATNHQQILVMGAGATAAALTSGATYHSWRPKLSPTGTLVLFNRTPGTLTHTHYDSGATALAETSVWVMNVDGTQATKIVTAPGAGKSLTTPNWTPTGRITYALTGKVKRCEPDGSGTTTLTPATTTGWSDLCSSPDGATLIGQRTSKNLWSITVALVKAAQLTTDATTAIGYFDPRYSPDGQWVYACKRLNTTANTGAGQYELVRLRPDGSQQSQVSPSSFTGNTAPIFNNPAPSADGWLSCGYLDGSTFVVARLLADGTSTRPIVLSSVAAAGYPENGVGRWLASTALRPTARIVGDGLVYNTSAETVLGTLTVPAGVRAGEAFRIDGYFHITTPASAPGTVTFRLRWGGVQLCTLVLTLAAGKTKVGQRLDGWVKVVATGAAGTAKIGGQLSVQGNATTLASAFSNATNVTAGVATTAANVLELTAQLSVASTGCYLVNSFCTIAPVAREVLA